MKCYFCKTESIVDRDEWGEWICPECKTANGSEEDILTGEQLDCLADNVGCPDCTPYDDGPAVRRAVEKIVANPQAGSWVIECPNCDYEVTIEEDVRFEDGFYWRLFTMRC